MPSQNDLDVIDTTVQKTYSWINDLREPSADFRVETRTRCFAASCTCSAIA